MFVSLVNKAIQTSMLINPVEKTKVFFEHFFPDLNILANIKKISKSSTENYGHTRN